MRTTRATEREGPPSRGPIRAALIGATLVSLTAVGVSWPAAASAQTVLVHVFGDASQPLFGALTHLVDASGGTVKSALSDERGRALFVGIPAGRYRLRAEMIGMATAETEPFDVAAGASVSQELRLAASAIQLEGIEVEADGGRCSMRPGEEGLAMAEVWDEARKALSAAAFTDQSGLYRYETMSYERRLGLDFGILEESQSRRDGYMRAPFESLPAEELVLNGFVQADGRESMYYAPDASVLLSDAFLDTHCFRLARRDEGTVSLVGLRFEPTGENRRVADIRGTLWLDESTAELRWLEYTYEYIDPDLRSDAVGGRVDFRRMPNGTWIVPEWWIRMPAVAQRTGASGRLERFTSGYLQTGGVVLETMEAGGRSLGQRIATGAVEGLVTDSIGVPRAGVRVGVVGSNQEVYTDSAGRYSITGLGPGRYLVRFVDPALEAVGFPPSVVARDVIRGEATALDHHFPSVGDILFESCRGEERAADAAVLAGAVVDGLGVPIPRAAVRVEWNRYAVRGRFEDPTIDAIETDGFETTADDRGAFRFCSVPTDMLLYVRAAVGEVEGDVHEVRIGLDQVGALQIVRVPGR